MSKRKENPKKTRARSKEDKAIQMEKILDGSLELIKDKGFFGFEMRALAKHLDMSKGNLYNYISSKRELWIAVRINCMRNFRKALEEIATTNPDDSIKALQSIGNYIFSFAEESRSYGEIPLRSASIKALS